jgi:hypothetical protein
MGSELGVLDAQGEGLKDPSKMPLDSYGGVAWIVWCGGDGAVAML